MSSFGCAKSATIARAQPPAKRGDRDHDADRPGAEHHGGIAGRDPGLMRGLHADGEGLDHRAFCEADIVGQLEGVIGGVDDGRA